MSAISFFEVDFMDKIRKFLALPLFYHGGLLVAFAILNSTATGMSVMTMELLLGVIVTPVLLAVLSVAHAIAHEGKVYDYIYSALTVLLVISVVRGVVYYVFDGGMVGLLLAAGALVVSVGVFTLWDCLFALTDRMMKKKPGKKRK